jgi:hypothetical protein
MDYDTTKQHGRSQCAKFMNLLNKKRGLGVPDASQRTGSCHHGFLDELFETPQRAERGSRVNCSRLQPPPSRVR